MPFFNTRAALLAAGALVATAGCNASGTAVPSGAPAANQASTGISAAAGSVSPADTTSILKLLTKDVVIGSTVDPTNGDTGPRSIAIATFTYGKLKKGDLLVCNFADSSGAAGNGTTIERIAGVSGSSPTTFVQSSKLKGCDGGAITSANQVYATGFTSKIMEWINQNGVVKKSYGSPKWPITQPIGDADGPPLYIYSPEYVWAGNADTGGLDYISLGGYGTGKVLEVVNGFPVNKGSGFGALGPSGISYWCAGEPGSGRCKNHADVLYVADGACNAIVAISHASALLKKDEITVESGCKSFKCPEKKFTCATLVKAGSPLDAPVAQTLLPNGNLVVANTKGGNTLVELTPTGKVLDTKVVDKSKTAGVFALFAVGTSDSNTAIYYTDTNTNTVHELQQ